ncbi:sugar phosphate nucleotidyltransferase [Bacillus sp. 7894-2]|uniref:mannose-1-phosphate guanylyltransferase n=1 Tax=Bacillus sp. 7894-2 TaxID=2021695 RepID=UPI000BA75AA0|nr:sugar phosphate nucleotidyltransferase [Bacillus sp. 7894-2]PAE26350.1 mannose-1-phosphate guanylyltransferase [Bacillus sp. 7894-2]
MKIVIMAGGQGTRFWPWSVKDKPKQFLPLMSKESMLQQTYSRFLKYLPAEKIFIVTTEEYLHLVKDQIPLINSEQIIIEPATRDTGPCMALAALHFLKNNDNEAFAAVPADHFIPEDSQFPEIFSLAENIAANSHAIVTLGITPTRPETGYGYIQVEEEVNEKKVLKVERFIEKPDLRTAKDLFKKKNIFWNSGIFIWKPETIEYYMKKFQPGIWGKLTKSGENLKTVYSEVPKISIDYAILEKADNIFTLPVNMEWDDVGNWSAWERLKKPKDNENLVQGDIHLLSANNCVINSFDRKAIVIGVEDLIIASTEDGLLVCHKSHEDKVKQVLKEIQARHDK